MTANTTTTSPQHPKPQTTREEERQALREAYRLLERVASRVVAHEAEKSGDA